MKNITLVNIKDIEDIMCEFCQHPFHCRTDNDKHNCIFYTRLHELNTIELLTKSDEWI